MKEDVRRMKKKRKEDVNILHCKCLVGGIISLY
jgi:hypothetical protein